MIDESVLDWFCLINSKGVGPKTFWAMLRAYKTAKESLKYVKDSFPRDEAKKILKSLKSEIILANDELFPKELKRSASCPPILFYRGDISLLLKKKIAIVGARNASINGMSIAHKLAKNLSPTFAIVSGLAKGIDTSAHKGSLENIEIKSAIAVLPFGIDEIYPKENIKLHEQIGQHGLLLSEVPPHRNGMDQGMFQARNRIIAMLSSGIIVIEAALKSGTMATAKLALDIGCEVMAVPGSPIDPRSAGCNLLIKNGATLIENHIDVLENLGSPESNEQLVFQDSIAPQGYDCQDKKSQVLAVLSSEPIPIDLISKYTNISMQDLLVIISDLEISEKIIKYSTNEIALIEPIK